MIAVENATILAGSFRLEGVQLHVPAGKYGVLMGETGSGKTTLVEGICGLRPVVSGVIRLGERDVTQQAPALRNIGYVPQDAALFPRMNVRRHLTFPLEIRKWRGSDIDCRTDELVEILAIEHLLHRGIHGLSGGERQRVAIGRALSWGPTTLLLDEPFSALDENTRAQMVETLQNVQRETGTTVLHVTHNDSEARLLANQLFLLQQGGIVSLAEAPDRVEARQKTHSA